MQLPTTRPWRGKNGSKFLKQGRNCTLKTMGFTGNNQGYNHQCTQTEIAALN
jgi:hypothetical protein